jgi:mercuric reductase
VASVGLTEEACREGLGECISRTIGMEHVPMAVASGNTRGLVKVVAEAKSEIIVGVHILAEQATELIQPAVMAVQHRLTIGDLERTPHVYPTFSQALKLAAQSFRRDIKHMACCMG